MGYRPSAREAAGCAWRHRSPLVVGQLSLSIGLILTNLERILDEELNRKEFPASDSAVDREIPLTLGDKPFQKSDPEK